MMKKVLYGVALALLAIVSVGSLQSCKDDVNDLRTQTSYDLSKVRYDLSELQKQVDGNSAKITAMQGVIDVINGKIGDLQQADKDLWAEVNGLLSLLPGDLQDDDVLATQRYVDGQIAGLRGMYQALKDAYDVKIPEIEARLDAVEEDITNMKEDIAAIEDALAELQNQIDSLIERLDKQVTGILIQGVYSPVFGDFRLPIGIKSNMLFNWYGVNNNGDIEFPTKGANFEKLPAGLTVEEPFKVADGETYGNEGTDVTLGKVYVTLNPVGAVFDNLELDIENSKGDKLPMTVALTPSDKVLYHGYTRAEAEGNGFYEGEVKVSVNDIAGIEYKIEEGLKTSIKDAIKNPSTMTAKSLVKAVYDQLTAQGVPAYGLRYNWSSESALEDVDNPDAGFSAPYSTWAFSVLSQYDLAVATAKPLSYNFLKDYPGASKVLPTIGHIQNIIDRIKDSSALKFELNDITVGEITIDFSTIKVDVEGEDLLIVLDNVMVDNGQGVPTPGTIVISSNADYDKTPEYATYTNPTFAVINGIEGEKGLYGAIESGIKSALNEAGGKISTEIQNQLQTQINNVIGKLNDQIGTKITDMINSATDKLEPYFGKIDKAFDLYNKVANKVNNVLKNPNAYLQVCGFYSMGGNDFGMISGVASDPTPAKSGNFNILLSSYTGELIVPACKKYVAITAKDGKTDNLAALNTGDLNKVLDGNQIEVKVEGLSAGLYEFTYMALDYNGYTSTKKFYIQVK